MPDRCGQGAFVQFVALVLVMAAVTGVMWLLVSGWAE